MRSIEILLQGHGVKDIEVTEAKPTETIGQFIEARHRADDKLTAFLEDIAAPLDRDAVIEELLPLSPDHDCASPPLRLHLSHCHRVHVVVRFNAATAERRFPPSATVERVRRWATKRAFEMKPRDAAEHVLQLHGGHVRPDPDIHIGSLTNGEKCAVAFDLVPFKRVEG